MGHGPGQSRRPAAKVYRFGAGSGGVEGAEPGVAWPPPSVLAPDAILRSLRCVAMSSSSIVISHLMPICAMRQPYAQSLRCPGSRRAAGPPGALGHARDDRRSQDRLRRKQRRQGFRLPDTIGSTSVEAPATEPSSTSSQKTTRKRPSNWLDWSMTRSRR
jgi:hypothetical protein